MNPIRTFPPYFPKIRCNAGLDDRGPAVSVNFSLLQRVQTGSGAHPASYPMSTGVSFSRVKRPGREADHSLSSSAEV
jgi:hypothetical protein